MKTRILPTPSKRGPTGKPAHRSQRGFTLLELMVAFAIGALLIGLSTPMAKRFYDTMQYRSAIRDLTAAATSARYQSIVNGGARDLVIDPRGNRFAITEPDPQRRDSLNRTVADGLELRVVSAAELRRGDNSVIRFYPDGSSSGGSVSVRRDNGAGVRLRVDWLLGNVTREPL